MSAPDTVTRTEPGSPSIAEPSRLVTERDEPANDDATSVLSDDWSAIMSKLRKNSFAGVVRQTGAVDRLREVDPERQREGVGDAVSCRAANVTRRDGVEVRCPGDRCYRRVDVVHVRLEHVARAAARPIRGRRSCSRRRLAPSRWRPARPRASPLQKPSWSQRPCCSHRRPEYRHRPRRPRSGSGCRWSCRRQSH